MYLSLRGAPTAGASRGGRVATPVILLGVTSLLTDVSSEMVATILPLYLTVQLGLSPLAYGFVEGIYQGVTVLVRVAGGVVADLTRRPKRVALLGYGTSAVMKLAMLPAGTLASVGTVVALDRAGKGVRTAPRDALIAASSAPTALGLSFGVHRALDTVGALIGPLLAFAMLWAVPGGFDAIFVVSFAFAVMGVAVLATWVPDLRPPALDRGRPGVLRQAAALVRDHAVRRTLTVAAVLSALTVGDGFLYLVLSRRADLPAEVFPLLFVGTAVTYLALAVPLGRLADRVGRWRVFLAGHVVLVAAYACAAGAAPGAATVIGCLGLLGVYYAATDGVLSALTSALLPETTRSTGLATVQTAVAAGRFVAALGFGALWTLTGPEVALVVFGAALLGALVPAARLLRPAAQGHGEVAR